MLTNNLCGGTHLNVYILRIVFKILYAHIEGDFIIRLAPITTKTCIPLGAICMLSSTTKKGEIESAIMPLIVCFDVDDDIHIGD